jgi:uncharacterized protein (DUF1330 family)
MAAYFLVEISEIFDASQYGEYIAGVKDIVEKNGGEYIVRSDRVSPFFGGPCPARVIIVKFKDRNSLEECFGSEEYKKIAALREASTKANACVVEEDEHMC